MRLMHCMATWERVYRSSDYVHMSDSSCLEFYMHEHVKHAIKEYIHTIHYYTVWDSVVSYCFYSNSLYIYNCCLSVQPSKRLYGAATSTSSSQNK